jgi:hypothetical protein
MALALPQYSYRNGCEGVYTPHDNMFGAIDVAFFRPQKTLTCRLRDGDRELSIPFSRGLEQSLSK